MEPIFINIGLKIKSVRKKIGLSATDLAKKSGLSKQQISNWENGRRAITLESILKIQPILEVPLADLLCMENVPNELINEKTSAEINKKNPHIELIISELKSLNSSLIFTVSDNSMEKLYRKNDIIIFNKNDKPNDGDLVLFSIKKTNQILFRKYHIDNTDLSNPKVKFVANHPDKPDIISKSNNEYKILGVCRDQIRIIN